MGSEQRPVTTNVHLILTLIVGSRCVQAATVERLVCLSNRGDAHSRLRWQRGAMVSPEEMRTRADTCKRMEVSFGPGNSEMMRDVAALWRRLADGAEAPAANPLRPCSGTAARRFGEIT